MTRRRLNNIVGQLRRETAARERETVTHYAHYDAPGTRYQRALCFALIPIDAHTNAPTCPECIKKLAEFNDEPPIVEFCVCGCGEPVAEQNAPYASLGCAIRAEQS